MIADGGAAPPVATSTTWSKRALHRVRRMHQHVEHDRRAAQVRDAMLADRREDQRRIDRRRHTCVPPTAVTAHVYVQPLQWNIGSVHR